MARPYILWEPGANKDLIVSPNDGPLVISSSDLSDFPLSVSDEMSFSFLFPDEITGYGGVIDAVQGTVPESGCRMRFYEWLAERMSFNGGGEAAPVFREDNTNNMYTDCAYRRPIRGNIGSQEFGAFNAEFMATWADSQSREFRDRRGLYTGIGLTVSGDQGEWFTTITHGKRYGDDDWLIVGTCGQVGSWPLTDTQTLVRNGTNSEKFRIVLSGSAPLWTMISQYWSGAAWVTFTTNTLDIHTLCTPGTEDTLAVKAFLFAAPTRVNPSPPTLWPISEIYFDDIELTQFDPYVIDTAKWTVRDFKTKFNWITPLSGDHVGIEPCLIGVGCHDAKPGVRGSATAPVDARVYDADAGWCVRFGSETSFEVKASGDWPGDKNRYALLPADNNYLGDDAPFAVVHRWKFEDIASWTTRRGIINFGPTYHEGSYPTKGEAGLGVFWEPASGPDNNRLIARCYDMSKGKFVWTEIEYDFEPSDWEGQVVDIALAYTGARGFEAGPRDDYEFRLLINGRTVGSAVMGDAAAFRVDTSRTAHIGASPWETGTESVEGLWAGGGIFIDAMTDYQIEKCLDFGTLPFVNDSYETASTDERPGEAYHWDWNNIQLVGQWADFNSYDADLNPWFKALESFEAAWDDNQLWLDLFAALDLTAAVFNSLAGAYSGTVETFAVWTWPDEHPLPPVSYTGTPWSDAFSEWRTDDYDQPSGPVGFTSWWDHLAGTVQYPVGVESFEETWGNDPLSTSTGTLWQPNVAPNGRILGNWITLPITITPDKDTLYLYRGATDEAVKISLVAGEYTDITTLSAMLTSALASAIVTSHALAIGYNTDATHHSGEYQIWIGWDGVTYGAELIMLMALERTLYDDAREVLGLAEIGVGGNMNGIDYPAGVIGTLPLDVAPDDVFKADTWSYSSFAIVQDPTLGNWFPLVYDQIGAIFETILALDTYLEQFLLTGWFGAGATWRSAYAGPDLSAASFDFGTPDQSTIETFIDTRWPDEIWT